MSVIALSDSTEAVAERYSYTAYGEVTTFDTDYLAPQSKSRFDNPYLFTGREYDSETGLYHYRARTYHPRLGRFLQRDPKEYVDGYGLSEYVGSAALSRIDPYGSEWEWCDVLYELEQSERGRVALAYLRQNYRMVRLWKSDFISQKFRYDDENIVRSSIVIGLTQFGAYSVGGLPSQGTADLTIIRSVSALHAAATIVHETQHAIGRLEKQLFFASDIPGHAAGDELDARAADLLFYRDRNALRELATDYPYYLEKGIIVINPQTNEFSVSLSALEKAWGKGYRPFKSLSPYTFGNYEQINIFQTCCGAGRPW